MNASVSDGKRLLMAAGFLSLLSGSPHAATLFGLVDTGELFTSSDGGQAWEMRSVLPVSDATGLAAGASGADLYLVSRAGTVYRSGDAGLGWTAVGTVTSPDAVDIVARPDGRVTVLTESGTVWRSEDMGASFSPVAALTASDFVSLGPDGSGSLYALTRTGIVERSDDWGDTWSTVGSLTVSDAVSIRALGGNLFVLSGAGDASVSLDMGSSWVTVGTLSQVGMIAMTHDGNSLVAATREGEVATSTDGVTWTWRGTMNQLTVTALANDAPLTSSAPGETPGAPRLSMDAPWPNPRRVTDSETSFSFDLEREGDVRLRLYDAHGRFIAGREPEHFSPGHQRVAWDPGSLPAGTYFARMLTENGRRGETKLVVLR